MKKYILLLLLTLIPINSYSKHDIDIENINYGLTFISHTANQDERTSLYIDTETLSGLVPEFTIEFEMKLRVEDLAYGYVFRLIANDILSLDLVTNINTQKLNFIFVGAQNILANSEFKELKFEPNKWIKVKVQINKEEIITTVDHLTQVIPFSFGDFNKFKFYFGKNTHSKYYTTDVSPMTIRNLVIKNKKNSVVREWKMFRHNKEEVYDEIKNKKAIVENGIWEIDKHSKWNLAGSFLVNQVRPQIAYDSIQNRIFAATSDSLHIYYVNTGYTDKRKVEKGEPFLVGGSQLLFDNKRERLISYSIKFDDFVTYNFDRNEWSDQLHEGLPPIQHHNRYVKDDKLILFGGYGNHQYNAELAIHELGGHSWQIDTLSQYIPPRYLSAMGYIGDDKFLILGGYGSISGKQEESPTHFNDLYELNIQTKSVKKIIDLAEGPEPRVFAPSMIVEKNKQQAYMLGYNNTRYNSSIYLLSVNLDTYQQTILGDSIPFKFRDTESLADLFYNTQTGNLYAITLQEYTPDSYIIQLYALAYPPLKKTDIIQDIEQHSHTEYLFIAGMMILLLIGLVGYYIVKRKKHKSSVNVQSQQHESSPVMVPEKPVSKIILLGGFQIFNKYGEDITRNFTPVIRQLFLFILLNSINKGKGVTSAKIDETIWFGMDKTNASNNRSVNLRKLRLNLEAIEGVTISNENSYWLVKLDKSVTCDYAQAMEWIRGLEGQKELSKEMLEYLVGLTSAGVLLPNINTEWVDDYKAAYSNAVVNLLLEAIKHPEVNKDLKLLLKIADVILLQDNIDEDAIRIKCKVLYQTGQKGASKNTYDKFVIEYKRLLKSKPALTYEEIIGE